MGKQEIKHKETKLQKSDAVGTEIERTYTVEDSYLPTPKELEEYGKINPNIVEHLLLASQKEQDHRHFMEKEQLKLIKKDSKKENMMNWWGMFFIFLLVALVVLLSALALYLNRPWFSALFLLGAITTVSTSFIDRKDKK